MKTLNSRLTPEMADFAALGEQPGMRTLLERLDELIGILGSTEDGDDLSVDTATIAGALTHTGSTAGFNGTTPIAKRSNTAAVSTTAATSTNPFGFETQAQADALVTLANALRADLNAYGLKASS